MKKHCLVSTLIILSLLAGTAQAQVLIGLLLGDKVSSETFHLGAEIGVNLANLSELEGSTLKPGFHFGLLGEWNFANRLYLQPGLLPFDFLGTKNVPFRLDDLPPVPDSVLSVTDRSRSLNYFTVPIILKYALGGKEQFHIGAGPQISFLLSANDKYEGTATRTISIDEDVKDQLNSTDAGLVFYLEYKISGRYGPGISVRYYLGLTDTIKDNPGEAVRNSAFTIMGTIPVGGDPTQGED